MTLSRFAEFVAPVVAAVLTAAPVGAYVLLLLLMAAADVAIVLQIARLIAARRRAADAPVVALTGAAPRATLSAGVVPLALRRRTEPALRSRRPVGVVEMQVRWRHAVEAHRRAREGG